MVSIIIPTYRRPALLEEAVASVRAQTYPHWELVVVEDKHGGRGNACRNEGWRRARGEYILFLDDDDRLAPDCLRQRVQALDANRGLDFVVGRGERFLVEPGDLNQLWNVDNGKPDLDRFLKFDVPWNFASCLWKRTSLNRMAPLDERLPSMQDWDFHVRALAESMQFARLPVVDWYWREPSAGRESITRRSSTVSFVPAHERLIRETRVRVAERGCMTAERQRLFEGLYFWLARRSLGTEQKTWKRYHDEGHVRGWTYRTGRLFFQVPHGKNLWLRALRWLWSADFAFSRQEILPRLPTRPWAGEAWQFVAKARGASKSKTPTAG